VVSILTTLSGADAQVLPCASMCAAWSGRGPHGPRTHWLPRAGAEAQRHGCAPDTAVRVQSRGRRGTARRRPGLTPAGDPLAAGPATQQLRTRTRARSSAILSPSYTSAIETFLSADRLPDPSCVPRLVTLWKRVTSASSGGYGRDAAEPPDAQAAAREGAWCPC
jgi:hypothetical protein